MTRRDFLSSVAIATGSAAFGVAKANSDCDWLISSEEFNKLDLPIDNVGRVNSGGGWFHSVRHGKDNFIIYTDPEFAERWMAAHRHCKIERPRSKDRRIVIFRHYLYDEPLHRNKPLPKHLQRRKTR